VEPRDFHNADTEATVAGFSSIVILMQFIEIDLTLF
jgi:hypothetical protein